MSNQAEAVSLEVIELDGKLYVESRTQGYYAVRLYDGRLPASCECPDYKYRCSGMSRLCKHLAAAAAYVAEKNKPRCPHCQQPLPECGVVQGLPRLDHDKFQRRQLARFGGRR